MYFKIDYIDVKIPTLRLCKGGRHKRERQFRIADSVSVGSVVITHSLDVGLVANAADGVPSEIFGSYSRYDKSGTCRKYGGVSTVQWYDTDIKMSLSEWIELSKQLTPCEWYEYWRSRLGIEY
jgi:hypothetical protein|nr:MAG TPA: hypothetical protein [Caudoviricetes sp.]